MPQLDKSNSLIFTVLLAKPSNSNSRLRCGDFGDFREQVHNQISNKRDRYMKAHFDRIMVIDTEGGYKRFVSLHSKRTREMKMKNIK